MKRSNRIPDLWEAVRWATEPGAEGGGTSRRRLAWRALHAALFHRRAMQRWMSVVAEMQQRGMVRDVQGEYLRAVRPYVHRGIGFRERVRQLVDHADALEAAFQPAAFLRVASGKPLVLLELAPPPGYEYMRLQLRQSPVHSPEGELLLTLTLQRSAELQARAAPVDVGALAFSRFRIEGSACLVIGGVRGQRSTSQRISAAEINQALHGWKPSVLLVRVAQELARYWNLNLVGLDPAAHRLHGWSYRLSGRNREAGEAIFASYRSLWEHFGARNGPPGWVILPLDADDKLEATALSPEKRMRQTRRADYWLRTRNALRPQMRKLLQHAAQHARLSRVTQALTPSGNVPLEDDEEESITDVIPSRVLETGPGQLS